MEKGNFKETIEGVPQGGSLSPLLANIYLHYTLDLWFTKVVAKYCKGECYITRYADDSAPRKVYHDNYMYISIFVLKKEAKFKYKQIQLDNLEQYTNNLENLYMDMRKFRHDYINIISSMAAFIEEKDIKGLEEHFNKNIYPLNNKMNKNNYKLGLLKNIKLPQIKGLISGKVIRAQELGIDIIIDIVEPITIIKMDIIDLSRCLGIILANAIESALESEKKVIDVALINKINSVILVVANTFKGDIPALSKLFKEGFSTKGENRGLGLSNCKDMIGKYKNISLDTSISDVQFIQEITVSNKKVGSYSLGMKQRLGTAQSVLPYPPLLILDEPTNGLDPNIDFNGFYAIHYYIITY
ncbi:sensor histidine kinase [Clostridium estertheticum]|uniref:sensor histidine kinase n=1 Tax=Clostridium estertheticum TaxID=238834 RepID=UPI0029620E75|nr:GHKL domain-containing protein [Clostridium estertheticum]